MQRYNIIPGTYGYHTCRLTLMEQSYVGHVTFKIGGNCHGLSILESALEYLEDPCGFESDCQLRYDVEECEYSFVLSDGEKSLEYEVDYYELSDMIVAVEIIDYQDSGRTTLIEEDADCEFFEEDDRD